MSLSKTAVHILAICILIALTTLVYSNSFQGKFTLDDFVNILNNESITSFQPSMDGIIQAATGGPSGKRWGVEREGTRWLPNISFALNYYLHGENVFGYHLVNLIIHLLVAITFYLLCLSTLTLPIFSRSFTNKVEIAFCATLLWAIHPLQTNGVTYIVQRMTSLAALFYLAALFCYVKLRTGGYTGTKKYLALGLTILFTLLAFTSKENTYMLPFIFLGYDLFFISGWPHGRDYKKLLPWLLLITVILVCCILFFQGEQIFSQILKGYQYREFSLKERLLTESRVFFLYLSLILLPLPSRLNLNHDIILSHGILSPPQTLFSIAGILALLALIIILYKKYRLLAFGIFWFMANLVIESTVIPLELVYEHRLYLPSTFLLLGITASGFHLARSRPWTIRSAIILLLICFSLWTWQRNRVWTDNLTLWSDVVAKSPNSERAHNNLGTVYHDRGQLQEAEQQFLQAIRLAPNSRKPYVSLGSLYVTWNRYQEAMQMLQAGLARQPYLNPARIYHYMGVIYSKTGRYTEALSAAQKALQLDPGDVGPMITMGIALTNMGRYKEADKIFAESERKGLSGTNLYNNWGTVAFKLGQIDRAIEFFKKALLYDPDHPESHYNLGLAYGAKGLVTEARKEMMRSMELQQKNQAHQ